MRSVDLAVFADALAAEAAALASRLERARQRLRQAAIEHEARRALSAETVGELERLGVLAARAEAEDTTEIEEARASLAAVQTLQAWVERELRRERRSAEARSATPVDSGSDGDKGVAVMVGD